MMNTVGAQREAVCFTQAKRPRLIDRTMLLKDCELKKIVTEITGRNEPSARHYFREKTQI
jgi:hypothetical protein